MNSSVLNASFDINTNNQTLPLPIKNKPIKKYERKSSVLSSLTQTKRPPLASQVEREKKMGLSWGAGCKLLTVGEPCHVTLPRCHKKYQVSVKWFDGSKIRQKTVRFGDKDKKYYYEHRNEDEKIRSLKLLRDYEDPLRPNFYVKHMLHSSSIKEGYEAIRNMCITTSSS